MAQLNFPETKIDVPVLALKQGRREAELPSQDGGEDFDRLVAKAAEKGKGRGEAAKANHRSEPNDESAAKETCATETAAPAGDTASPDKPAVEVAAAPLDNALEPVQPAALIAALLPVTDTPIKLPATNSETSATANLATPVAAANGNVKLQQPAEGAGANNLGAPDAGADIATLLDALPQAAEASERPQMAAASDALPQPEIAAVTAPPQLRVAAAQATASTPAAAAPEAESQAQALRPEITAKSASTAQRIDGPGKPAVEDQASLEAAQPAAPAELQPSALPLARHFVREVATQYQATAEAGSAARAAAEASAADQVSVRLIHSLHEGRKAVQIHLNPSELGSIDVSMQWQGDRLTAHFVVDRPETLDLLQRDIKILEQSLGDSGFSSDNGGLSFSLRQQMENQGERRSGNGTPTSEIPQNADPEISAEEPSAVRDGVLVLRV